MASTASRLPPPALAIAAIAALLAACGSDGRTQKQRPDVAPIDASAAAHPAAPLDAKSIVPMYREVLAIDLPTVMKVAEARNLDILAARARVQAARGQFESSIEGLFPVIAPGLPVEDISGVNRAVTGELVPANFTTVQPALLIQALINPGKIIFDIIAAKKRVAAAEQTSRAVQMEKLRQSAVQYYELILAQSRLIAAREAVAEASELLRITNARLHAGTGLLVDRTRAEAALSARQQDLAAALNAVYEASVTLAVSLDVDPTITLVPQAEQVSATPLVRDSMTIDEMLTTALYWRPDLKAGTALAKAASADRDAILWGLCLLSFRQAISTRSRPAMSGRVISRRMNKSENTQPPR